MDGQKSLFQENVRSDSGSGSLVLRSRPDHPLTKGQRTFNRLVARVEELRAKLQSETRRFDQALAYYGEHLHPRLVRLTAVRKEMVRFCAPYLNRKHLKRKNDREALRMVIAEQLEEIMAQEGSLADDDLLALFEKIHGVDFKQAECEEFDEARSAIESMFADAGIDIDLGDLNPDMSDAAIASKIAEMAERIQGKTGNEEGEMHRAGRRKTKRQLEKEERMRQAEEVRKKSIASIYKQLAKALHPDLEPDDERRRRKVVLMQELTAAYRNNDLHTLLRLELEWIHREERDLDRLTNEKLSIYNQVLREQVQELEQELAGLPCHPRYHPLAVPDGPFEVRLRTNGPAEAYQLDRTIASLEASVSRMRNGEALQEVRGVVHAYRHVTHIRY